MPLRFDVHLLLGLVLVAGACGFNPSGGELGDGDAAGDDPDATDEIVDASPDAAPVDIHHVPAAAEMIGTGDLAITADVTVDTGALTVTGIALEPGVELVASAQDGGGPELAILRVRSLAVASSVTLRAVGTRPLVVLADTITIAGLFDAGGHRGEPGAGGSGARAGTGKGADGSRSGSYADGGGGGAGFARTGASGGEADNASGGAGGAPYGDAMLTELLGGSGGGATNTGGCDATSPGAGGGAVQLYAATSIVITATGAINAGGGGGSGGASCTFQYLAGTGGGSGGAIYLQAPAVSNGGVLAANGGGGGGGASGSAGGPGQDGSATTARATGGTSGGTSYGAAGGRGGSALGDATDGDNGPGLGNGGGGGGATGHIVIRHRDTPVDGTTSPAATIAPY